MSKLKSKKPIIIGVSGFILASAIIGATVGVTVNKQNSITYQEVKLRTKKSELNTKINELMYLSSDEVTKFTTDISNAQSLEEADELFNKANQQIIQIKLLKKQKKLH
ncbi:GA module-containing protein [Ureaplasma diversum]|uniref:Protein G-related albumin-binding (GA) module domain-containing protein n=1 Tax=Ureaplasma diversum NCTC 246 TaxID=1188241 RepID=A0A084F0N6_9BACT|nr:GA module-containing protein [Ureaplasma diversum]KEZ23778.1 Hypothetical protein, predicted transmembrane protein [Ureaplasma diversum NCTC 246]